MPGGDRTGPMGQGPRTGRGRNNCAPNATSSRPYYGRRLGGGFGRGLGRGLGYRYSDGESVEQLTQEKKVLEERISYIDSKLTK